MMQERCRLDNALSVFVLINLCAIFRVGFVWIYECKKSVGTLVRYLWWKGKTQWKRVQWKRSSDCLSRERRGIQYSL